MYRIHAKQIICHKQNFSQNWLHTTQADLHAYLSPCIIGSVFTAVFVAPCTYSTRLDGEKRSKGTFCHFCSGLVIVSLRDAFPCVKHCTEIQTQNKTMCKQVVQSIDMILMTRTNVSTHPYGVNLVFW